MDGSTLRKVQLTQLEIAKEIKRVCIENDIDYFLDGGTLIGAIRHQGFIPWDDDLDIGMTRANYERFLELAPVCLGEGYLLQSVFTDNGYGAAFSKVQKRGTRYVEARASRAHKLSGIYVDVFPFDRCPNDLKEREKQAKELWLLRRLLLMKAGYSPWAEENGANIRKFFGYLPIRFIAVLSDRRRLIEMHERVAKRWNNSQELDFCAQGILPWGSVVVPRADLLETIQAKFEDEYFSIPKGYDEYLTLTYGDYMTPPPDDQRENRHLIIDVDFGDSE